METYNSKKIEELVELIYQRIEENFDKKINNSNVEMTWTGIVLSFNSTANTANVSLPFGETLENIPNLSGTTLNQGQKVKVYADKLNMINAYVGTAF